MGKSGSLPRWQLCRGISGSFRVEWVAGFVWNQWQPWSGIRKPGTQRLYTVDWGERRFGIVAVLLRKLLREVLALLFGVSAVCPVKTFNQAVMLVLKGFSGMDCCKGLFVTAGHGERIPNHPA